MNSFLQRVGAIALALLAIAPVAPVLAQEASEARAPAGFAPLQAPCVVRQDGPCQAVSPSTPMPIASAIYDPTGLVSGHRIINESRFLRSNEGWVQLFTPLGVNGNGWGDLPGAPTGTVTWASHSGGHLEMRTPNKANAQQMAIRRMTMVANGRYVLEWRGAMKGLNLDTTRPLSVQWGLDTETAEKLRRFFEVRFYNYDEASTTRVAKMQCHTEAGGWADIPTPSNVDPIANTNENKASPAWETRLGVDTDTGLYLGFAFDTKIQLGIFKPLTATTTRGREIERAQNIADFQAICGRGYRDLDLPGFVSGFNPTVVIRNRTNASASASALMLFWQRTTAIDLPGGTEPMFPSAPGAIEETNFLLANYPLSQTVNRTAEVICEPGSVLDYSVALDSINGSPTAGSWNVGFEYAPWIWHGYSLDSETSGDLRPFVPIAANDNALGHMLVDGGWPAPAFSYTDTPGKQVTRSIRCSANARIIRLVLTPSGVTPTTANAKVTVMVTKRAA